MQNGVGCDRTITVALRSIAGVRSFFVVDFEPINYPVDVDANQSAVFCCSFVRLFVCFAFFYFFI